MGSLARVVVATATSSSGRLIRPGLCAGTSVRTQAAFRSSSSCNDSPSTAGSSQTTKPKVPLEQRYVHKAEVERFIVDAMFKVGTELEKARMLAGNLSEADYRGHFSHGLSRLSMYVNECKEGLCEPNANPRICNRSPATAWVDGRNGLGVVVGTFCMQLAIEMAKDVGVGWVVAKESNHFGICQWYTDMAVDQGLVGLAFTNTSPVVTPTRACKPVFGTNPLALSAPGARDDDRFTIDMATSTVAIGKIEMQMRKNEKLPSTSWALGRDGKPTVDPEEAFYHGKGLMPLGGEEINSGYKGYGLAMLVEVMTSIMAGSTLGPDVRRWTAFDREANLGQCLIAVNPEMFAPGVKDRMQKLMDHARTVTPVDAALPVLVPGDPERMSRRTVEEEQDGAILYTSNHILAYHDLAKHLGIEPMRPHVVSGQS